MNSKHIFRMPEWRMILGIVGVMGIFGVWMGISQGEQYQRRVITTKTLSLDEQHTSDNSQNQAGADAAGFGSDSIAGSVSDPVSGSVSNPVPAPASADNRIMNQGSYRKDVYTQGSKKRVVHTLSLPEPAEAVQVE